MFKISCACWEFFFLLFFFFCRLSPSAWEQKTKLCLSFLISFFFFVLFWEHLSPWKKKIGFPNCNDAEMESEFAFNFLVIVSTWMQSRCSHLFLLQPRLSSWSCQRPLFFYYPYSPLFFVKFFFSSFFCHIIFISSAPWRLWSVAN